MSPCFKLRLELCHKLKIFYIIEQPESSLLFRYKPFWRLLKKHGAHRVKCSLGAFNALTVKPVPRLQFWNVNALFICRSSWLRLCLDSRKVVFWGTAPFLKKLSRQVTSKQRRQQQFKGNKSSQASSAIHISQHKLVQVPASSNPQFPQAGYCTGLSKWCWWDSLCPMSQFSPTKDYWMNIGGTCSDLELHIDRYICMCVRMYLYIYTYKLNIYIYVCVCM